MKIRWGGVALVALLLIIGIGMIIKGIIAYKTGAVIPATRKIPPMTGLQSIIAGVIATVASLYFVIYEVIKGYNNDAMFIVQNIDVIILDKNKSWGGVQSLILKDCDAKKYIFYSSGDKVAASILSDFIVNQKAVLKITSENGDCDLESETSTTSGRVAWTEDF